MKTSLITSLSIMLALVGQGAVTLATSTSPAQASEAIATVSSPTNSRGQPVPVIPFETKQEVDKTSPKLQPVEIARKPVVDSNRIVDTTRLRQIAESVRIDRNSSTEPQRIILIELP